MPSLRDSSLFPTSPGTFVPGFRGLLGCAYFDAGRLDDARAHAAKALSMARQEIDVATALELILGRPPTAADSRGIPHRRRGRGRVVGG